MAKTKFEVGDLVKRNFRGPFTRELNMMLITEVIYSSYRTTAYRVFDFNDQKYKAYWYEQDLEHYAYETD